MSAKILDTISVRTSCRAYDGRPLTERDRQELAAHMEEAVRNPFGRRVRLLIIDAGVSGKVGTYGMVTGAKTYLSGAVEKGEKSLVAYGYAVEKMVLKATAMGIGTCWLGGTFTRGAFAEAIGLTADEWLPAVTPLGYPKKPGLRARAVRAFTGAASRKNWREVFFQNSLDTPLTLEEAGVYAGALESVRLGPSAVNRQPWRVVWDESGFHFHTAGRGGADPEKRFDHMDLGIAMCHFELTARERRLPGDWEFAGAEMPGLEYIATWRLAQ
jgi:nitroreductase